MKKVALLFVALLVIAGCSSESEKLQKQYSKLVNGIDKGRFATDQYYRMDVEREASSLLFAKARAYNDERKPDSAITDLEFIIKQIQQPEIVFGQTFSRGSASLNLEAIYYDELAKSFELKGDSENQKKAFKKAETIRKKSAEVEKQEKQKEEKERENLLK